MNKYELALVVTAKIDDNARAEVVEKAKGYITRANGEITGIEYSASSIAMAKRNAARMGQKGSYHAGDAARILQTALFKSAKPVQVLCDPPRAGLDSRVVSWLLEKRPEHIIYISCNPATLARDILALQKAYRLEQTTSVDMFPQTPHVETVSLLTLENCARS